jgi:hypothetical protein
MLSQEHTCPFAAIGNSRSAQPNRTERICDWSDDHDTHVTIDA